jgi:hypothetical protein
MASCTKFVQAMQIFREGTVPKHEDVRHDFFERVKGVFADQVPEEGNPIWLYEQKKSAHEGGRKGGFKAIKHK